eukprot:1045176-Pelagomonas_calceolata.AAC.1
MGWTMLIANVPSTFETEQADMLGDSAGQVLALMGPSGSGKTSLLAVLGGRTPPRIKLEGQVRTCRLICMFLCVCPCGEESNQAPSWL